MNLMLETALFLRSSNSDQYNLMATDIAILLMLASHIGEREFWYISQTELAKECKLTVWQLNRRVKVLERKNLLTVRRTGRASAYALMIPVLRSTADHEIKQPVQEVAELHVTTDQICAVAQNRSALHHTHKETITKQKKTSLKPIGKKVDSIVLPDWLTSSDWDAFKKFRKEIKAPLTQRGEKLAIGILEKLKAAGENIEAVIEQTIVNNWKSFYPEKKQNGKNGSNGQHKESYIDRLKQAGESILRRQAGNGSIF